MHETIRMKDAMKKSQVLWDTLRQMMQPEWEKGKEIEQLSQAKPKQNKTQNQAVKALSSIPTVYIPKTWALGHRTRIYLFRYY